MPRKAFATIQLHDIQRLGIFVLCKQGCDVMDGNYIVTARSSDLSVLPRAGNLDAQWKLFELITSFTRFGEQDLIRFSCFFNKAVEEMFETA